MFGLFETPRCPRCNGKLTATGYSFPYPQARCVACIKKNKEMKKQIAEEVKKQLASINK